MNTAPATLPETPVTAPTSYAIQSQSGTATVDVQDSLQTAGLQQRLEQIVKDNEAKGITTSVSVHALHTGRTLYSHNSDAKHFAASLNKMPISLLLLEDLRSGKLQLEQQITWQPSDLRGGFGQYDQPGAAQTATVRQLMFDMLNYSGNTAVRALVNYVLDGPQAVNDRLATYPELKITRLTVLGPTSFYLGDSTSAESLWVTERLLAGSDEYQAFIKEALATNIFSYYGVRSQLESQDLIVLANKVGILDDIDGNNRHDTGLIYNTRNGKVYGYSFMTTTPYGQTAATAHAEHSLDLLGRQVLRHAGDKPDNKPFKANPNSQQAAPETRVRY